MDETLLAPSVKNFLDRMELNTTLPAPYHPASNELAERAVQTVKHGLKKITSCTLTEKIAQFLFRYQITPQSTTGVSPAELLLGRRPHSQLDLLKPDLLNRVRTTQNKQKQVHDKHAVSRSFEKGNAVYVRNFGQGPEWLAGYILDNTGCLS